MCQEEQRQLRGTRAEIYERGLVPAIFAPWAAVLIKQAALQPGERVLDVACGTGVVARLAAQQVGSTGRIAGLDKDAERLAVARSLPPIPGVSLEWQEGDALAMPFADASFDAVLCQQGLQFFADRPAALREMRRVLAPGGRLILSVWGSLEQCPGYAALVGALERHLCTAAASEMHSFFALAEASEVRSLFAGGPFNEFQLHTAVRTARFASPERFVRIEMILMHPESPDAGMGERALAELIGEVNTALQPYVSSDGLAFPIQAHLVTALRAVA